jgi:hypothetical protein
MTSWVESMTSISPRFLDDIKFDFRKWVGSHGHGCPCIHASLMVTKPPTPGLTFHNSNANQTPVA